VSVHSRTAVAPRRRGAGRRLATPRGPKVIVVRRAGARRVGRRTAMNNECKWTAGEEERIEIEYRDQIGRCDPVARCPGDGAQLKVFFRRVPEGRHPEHPEFGEFLEFACETCGRSFQTPW
jgi:hypothetical protein